MRFDTPAAVRESSAGHPAGSEPPGAVTTVAVVVREIDHRYHVLRSLLFAAVGGHRFGDGLAGGISQRSCTQHASVSFVSPRSWLHAILHGRSAREFPPSPVREAWAMPLQERRAPNPLHRQLRRILRREFVNPPLFLGNPVSVLIPLGSLCTTSSRMARYRPVHPGDLRLWLSMQAEMSAGESRPEACGALWRPLTRSRAVVQRDAAARGGVRITATTRAISVT